MLAKDLDNKVNVISQIKNYSALFRARFLRPPLKESSGKSSQQDKITKVKPLNARLEK